MKLSSITAFILLILFLHCFSTCPNEFSTVELSGGNFCYLELNDWKKDYKGTFPKDLEMGYLLICYDISWSLINTFAIFEVQINLDNDEDLSKMEIIKGINDSYTGLSESIVENKFYKIRSPFSVNPVWKTCFALKAEPQCKFEIHLAKKQKFNLLLFTMFIIGVSAFIFAEVLSRNVLFYYTSGVTIGLIGSLLILLFILSRFIPKKSLSALFLLSGTFLSIPLYSYICSKVFNWIHSYNKFFIAYFTFSGLISFAVIYIKLPNYTEKTSNIVKWCMQLFAVILMYFSVQIFEAFLAITVILFISQYIPTKHLFMALSFVKIQINKRRRVPVRLLTDEEFRQQGTIETEKALENLRKYCNSPDCNIWKTMSKLNSPNRFAEFMDGSLHVSNNEIKNYNNDLSDSELYSDDSSDYTDFHLSTQ